MQYRRVSVRRTVIVQASPIWPFDDPWHADRVRLLVQARWRPDADLYETPRTVEVIVDLAGVNESEVQIELFDDVIIVEGDRGLACADEGAVYHAAGIRRGPFRLEIPLPAAIAGDAVEARYDGGLLRITLPKGAARYSARRTKPEHA